jgi:alkylation response protein AidB-like acyl-CoA dehydrogenase
MVFEDGAPVFTDAGLPNVTVVWLPRDAVEITDTWQTTGLAGSGSNDYSVTEAFVPENHAFHPFRVGPRTEPLYRYHGFFFANLPAVALGCAQRMLDDLLAVATTKMSVPAMTPIKDEYRVQLVVAEATAKLAAARLYQDDVLTRLWERVEADEDPSREERAALGLMMVHVAQSAREIAESVCEAVGADAIYRRSAFERRRRDLVTIAAHVVSQRKSMARIAGLLFGDDPQFLYV